MSVVPIYGNQRQEDWKFEVISRVSEQVLGQFGSCGETERRTALSGLQDWDEDTVLSIMLEMLLLYLRVTACYWRKN